MEREKIAPGKENPSYLPDKGGVKATRGFAAVTQFVQPDTSGQTASNGLPAQLKSGLEGLSGLGMDDVRVNYNSPAPRQVGALAYAKGNQIHLGPGQEKHLPHEAWHVVQQKQGRVAPGIQLKGGEYINNDTGLEKEADVMGSKAMQMKHIDRPVTASGYVNGNVLQRVREVHYGDPKTSHLILEPMQVAEIKEDKVEVEKSVDGETKEETPKSGAPKKSQGEAKEDPEMRNTEVQVIERQPLIIEVNETKAGPAISKINSFVGSGLSKDLLVAFIIGINSEVSKLAGSEATSALEINSESAKEVAFHLETKNLHGGAIPFVWKATKSDAYKFPFLEARSLLTRHPGALEVHYEIGDLSGRKKPVVRSMDGDVTSDPLLTEEEKLSTDKRAQLIAEIKQISEGDSQMFSGGYNWNADDDVIDGLTDTDANVRKAIKAIIRVINDYEHQVRAELASKSDPRSIYWPEPNTYMGLGIRSAGASAMHKAAIGKEDQQRESTYYVNRMDHKEKVIYNEHLSVTKPLKTHFSGFFTTLNELIKQKNDPEQEEIEALIKGVRQSHLDPTKVEDIFNWNHGPARKNQEAVNKIEDNKKISQRYLTACAGHVLTIITGIPKLSRNTVSKAPKKGKGGATPPAEAKVEAKAKTGKAVKGTTAPAPTAPKGGKHKAAPSGKKGKGGGASSGAGKGKVKTGESKAKAPKGKGGKRSN